MKMMRRIFALLVLVGSACHAMGGGGEERTDRIPQFHELDRGEPSYVGTVVDNGAKMRIHSISFTGKTTLGGLQSETDDSIITLDLGDILELEVLNRNYFSKKFDKDFIKIKMVPKRKTKTGEHKPSIRLVPRRVQFSAIDVQSNFKRGWNLFEIKKIKIDDPQPHSHK